MNIVLNVTETERWSVLTQCIEGELCLAEEIESEKGNGTYVIKDTCPLPLVDKLLSEKRPNKIVIFYQQAEVYIAESINDGMPIASASEQWLLKIQKLIEIQKRNRSKIILINAEQACTEVGRLNQLLNNSGISFIENIEIKEIAETFFLLLAAHFVVQKKNIKDLNLLLQASSLPVTNGNQIVLDFEKVIAERSESKKNNEKEQKNSLYREKLFKEENSSLVKNINFLNEEKKLLEEKYIALNIDSQKMSQTVYEMKSEVVKERNIRKKIESEIKELQDKDHSEVQEIKKKCDDLQSKNLDMVNDISDIEEDRSVVLRQLYRVQEELEYVYLHGGLGEIGKELDVKIRKLKEEKQKVLIQLRYVSYCLALQEKESKKNRNSAFGKLSNIIFSLNKKSKKRQSVKKKVEEDIKLILLSNYFDDEWYLEQYPDVKASGINPAEHYLQHGSKEGRKPSQLFDGEWYLEAYSDVKEAGVNPLLHYIKYGKEEERVPSSDAIGKCDF